MFRKALSFASHKWDLHTDTPKESGTTVEDVIEYVRVKMYRLLKTKKSDSEDDEEIEYTDTDDESKYNVDGEDGDSDYVEEDDELEVPDDYIFPS